MNFVESFRRTLAPDLLLSVAPNGKCFASIENGKHILLTGCQTGNRIGKIEFKFDAFPRLTCLTWATRLNLFVGNESGDVIQVNLNKVPCPREMPPISFVMNRHIRPVKATSFDVSKCLLALALNHEVQIWGIYTDHQWRELDEVKCQQDKHGWQVSNVMFFGSHRYLLIVTSNGFIVWTGEGKPASRLEGKIRDFSSIGKCDISHDDKWLVASTESAGVLVWPLSHEGPVMDQQRTFSIPTVEGQVVATGPTPVAFLDEQTIIVADPTGTIYTMSLAGAMKQAFSVGPNTSVYSIWVREGSVNMFATDAMQTPVLIGYTSDEATHDNDGEE
ncbi:hypothetical protein FRC08_017028 [Ceratobasidium sp. 394]|nr:hypothetical protein FRC08_017028 [Ceratobasidium sp. 394]